MQITSRSGLDPLLADVRKTLLLLFGDTEAIRGVHQLAVDEVETDVRVPLWIQDLTILRPEEATGWEAGADRYAVVRDSPRRVAKTGHVDDLVRQDDSPSILFIRRAFTEGA